MIKVDNLSFSFSQKDLYQNISFTIEDGEHCAFIGTSGSGKSTLIDILRSPDRYMYDGTLEISPSLRIGYVSQFLPPDHTKDLTVIEFISEEFIKLQHQITEVCTEMESSLEIDALLIQYQEALDAFHAIGGEDFESNMNKQLMLANLNKQADLPVSKLSGGEFKLIQVIKEMLTGPDLMIMDEPDVFLDFENLNSLKDLINSHKGSMLVITHNRYLLNHCFNKILHLENKLLQEFNGRYLDYNFSLLQSKIELMELADADTQEIERNEVLIQKLRSAATIFTEASRGKSLKARIKIQERLEARRIKVPFVEIKQPNIRFVTDTPSENTLCLKVKDYHAAFDELLLEHVNFELNATDKVALIGANGTGKTTLLRDIYQHHHAVETPDYVTMAFLSQFQGEMLEESAFVSDEFFQMGFETYDEITAWLSNYGFDEKILYQKIGSLSGGEKNLLQLAKIGAGRANLLLLDEPTSHLDTYSQLALEQAIANYKGAILMISHDFYTIVNCMDYVLIIEDQTIRKLSMRKFRQRTYARHFDKDYLETEQKKKAVETKIELALKDHDFTNAKVLSEELEKLLQSL